MLLYILLAVLLGIFFYITYVNSHRHAYILLGIAVTSIGIWYIRPIQMYSLLGIAGIFVVMIASRTARERNIRKWLAKNGFQQVSIPAPGTLFTDEPVGNKTYRTCRNVLVNEGRIIPFIYVTRYTSYMSGRTMSLVVDCCYYFSQNITVTELEQQFLKAKETTPHTGLLKSQLHYFDLKNCTVFKPAGGGIAVSWRVPDTVQGYNERYQWIKNSFIPLH